MHNMHFCSLSKTSDKYCGKALSNTGFAYAITGHIRATDHDSVTLHV